MSTGLESPTALPLPLLGSLILEIRKQHGQRAKYWEKGKLFQQMAWKQSTSGRFTWEEHPEEMRPGGSLDRSEEHRGFHIPHLCPPYGHSSRAGSMTALAEEVLEQRGFRAKGQKQSMNCLSSLMLTYEHRRGQLTHHRLLRKSKRQTRGTNLMEKTPIS